MRSSDIYLVSLDPTASHEQSGSRLVLIISPAEFNEATKLSVILPITNGGEFARRLGFAVTVNGIETTGVIRCDQPRAIDLAARCARKVDTLPGPSTLSSRHKQSRSKNRFGIGNSAYSGLRLLRGDGRFSLFCVPIADKTNTSDTGRQLTGPVSVSHSKH